jgi:hypothetical protein
MKVKCGEIGDHLRHLKVVFVCLDLLLIHKFCVLNDGVHHSINAICD